MDDASTTSEEERQPTGMTARMKQMESDQWFPMHTPHWSVAGLVLIAAVLIPLGAAIILATNRDFEEVVVSYGENLAQRRGKPCNYDERRDRAVATPGAPVAPSDIPETCDTERLVFDIPAEMKAPVYVYYRLDGFNQNFRSMVRSRSDAQLAGASATCDCEDTVACKPFAHAAQSTADTGFKVKHLDGTERALDTLVYSPCGHIAWVMFNDSFVLSKQNSGTGGDSLICDTAAFDGPGAPIETNVTRGKENKCSKRGIAWSGDVDTRIVEPKIESYSLTRYGYPAADEVLDNDGNVVDHAAETLRRGDYYREHGHRIPLQTDLDFMVWLRPAVLPEFNKLHRIINQDLPAGRYTLDVAERYPAFGGEKKFVLATRSWAGGSNLAQGIAYVVCGSMGLVFAAFILVMGTVRPLGGYTPEAFEALE